MICYSEEGHKAFPPGNKINKRKDYIKNQDFVPGSHLPKFGEKQRIVRKKSNTFVGIADQIFQKERAIKNAEMSIFERTETDVQYCPSNLISGYAYSCTESFCNRSFNMVYVENKSEEERKLMDELQSNFDMI